MRDWAKEKEARVSWIKNIVASCGAKGVVFGNSGGKDCALTDRKSTRLNSSHNA